MPPQARSNLTPLFVAALWAASFGPAAADVATIAASADNTIYSEADSSNGAGDHFFAGRTNDGVLFLRRALIRFDVAAAVPAGSTINSVTLTLYRSRGKNGSFNVELHRLLASWGEAGSDGGGEEGQGAPAQTGDATWRHRLYPSTFWATLGGDYAGTASATTSVGGDGFYDWSSGTMTSDVQAWLNTPSSNFGWILVGVESQNRSARRFDSRTNPTVTQRPKLVIDYTPSVVVGACCLSGNNCSVLTPAQCSAQGGIYQGNGTSCSPNPCFVPTGACCFNDGSCEELSGADCASQGGTYHGDGSACTPGLCPVVLTPYLDALPIPGTATPTSGVPGGVATYDIAAMEFTQQLHHDLPPTRVWGYNGGYPGPKIEAFLDRPVTVNWINDLRDSLGNLRSEHYLPVDLCMHGPDMEGPTARTVAHLHGGHVPAAVDGYPEATYLPGAGVTYVYPNHQTAAPLWYHDHAMGITRLNVYMGLAGLYTLRDSVEIGLGLPSGAYEIPIVIQDRTFNPDGSLVYPAMWMDHFFGDKVLVNGKVWPYLNVDRGKYRFRLLEGSNSRAYTLALSNGASFSVIGTDGGLLAAPVPVTSLTMVPGERYDVVIDFASYAPGTEIFLRNSAPAPFPGDPGVGVIPDVMKFVVQSQTGFTNPLPTTLRPVVPIPEGSAVATRDFLLRKQSDPCAGSVWTINGLRFDDITEYPQRGTAEIWRFVNDSGVVHPMHMHLVMYQILDRTPIQMVGDSIVVTGPPVLPAPHERGWKDTAPVYPNEMMRVIARFEDYVGKYPYHCHVLEHEDQEMMRQFEVVDPAISVVEPARTFAFDLGPARPNPFGPQTSVSFDLPTAARVTVRVLDVRGRVVDVLADGLRPAGRNEVTWRATGRGGTRVPAGIYFVEMRSGDFRAVRKTTVLQ